MPVVPTSTTLPDLVHAGDRSFTRAELVRTTSARRVRTAIARGEIIAVLPGRYASTAHSSSFAVRAHAATASTHGILTGAAALFLVGADDWPPRIIDVAAPHGTHVSAAPWMRVAGVRTAPPTARAGHLDLSMPEQAIIHAWSREPEDRRISLTLTSLQKGLATPARLREAMASRARLPDRAALERAIAAFEAGAHSYLEHEGLTRTFAGAEFARFLRQHGVEARGSRFRLDMYDPATRTAVELDGSKHHLAGERRERDIRRDADLATLGILTVRLAYKDVMDRPDWCRQTVRAVLAERERHDSAP